MMRNVHSLVFVLLLLLLSLVGACAVRDLSDRRMPFEEVDENQELVEELAEAVESYAETNQRYPDDLAALVPDYATVIVDSRDRPFEYRRGDDDDLEAGFSIGFWTREGAICVYYSTASGVPWECSGGAE